MKLTIQVDLIPTLDMIHQYLDKKEWKQRGWSYKWRAYQNLTYSPELLYIPRKESFADYKRRIIELLENLALIEERDTYDIWKDITKGDSE